MQRRVIVMLVQLMDAMNVPKMEFAQNAPHFMDSNLVSQAISVGLSLKTVRQLLKSTWLEKDSLS